MSPPALDGDLEQQIRAWAQRSRHAELPAGVLYLGLSWWSRLHGLVSLELGGHLGATGVDPGLLYQAEVQSLLSRLQPAGYQA
jgi:hypothetical protein